ncbi:MAG: sensor histidine kinase [Bellilinea sp.]
MNLRWTIFSIIVATFVGLVAILSISLQGILVPYFREEENRSVKLNVQRVIGVLENERTLLSEVIRNWATSDESYALISASGSQDIQSYPGDSLLSGLNINWVAFLNLRGEIVYTYTSVGESDQAGTLPADLTAQLQPGSPLLQTGTSREVRSGLIATSSGPLVLVSAPVLKSSGEGPAAGTLIAGRFMNSIELNRIAGVVRFPLTLMVYNQADLPQDFGTAKTQLTSEESIVVIPASDAQISGFALLQDFYGEPAYILRVEQGRSIYGNSQIVLLYLYTAVIMGALLFSVMTFLAFDRLALARIRQLGREVTQIGAGGDLSARVTVERSDELTQVAREINGMLANLQALSHRLVEIQESERRKIALELHDEIGQLLTGLKLQLDTNPENIGAISQLSLNKARALSDELIQKVRNLSLDLRPTMLDDLGLLPALLWHFDRFTALTGVNVDFSQSGISDRRFTPELESTAYRIIQEALTNMARHSSAQEASVRATYSNRVLTIQVEDRGSGFAVQEKLATSRTRGLHGMKERVALVGGSLTIDSVPGWGTSILVELPARALPEEGDEDDNHIISG